MAQSQIEINYENALKAKSDASKSLADANQAALNQASVIERAESDYNAWGKYDCEGYIYYYDPNALARFTAFKKLKDIIGCTKAFQTFTSNNPEQAEGLRRLQVTIDARNNVSVLNDNIVKAKQAYDSANAAAASAYRDYVEWKKGNMSPAELQEFLDVEQQAAGGALRMDAWKWAGIGIGVIAFGWLAWYLIKRFKGVKVI